MNKNLFVLLALVGGMAGAQTSNNNAGASAGQNVQSGQRPGSNLPVSQQTLRGCLKHTGGSWSISQSGQEVPLTGDTSMLNTHIGQQVEVQGMQPAGESLQVTAVTTIANSCLGERSAGSSGQRN